MKIIKPALKAILWLSIILFLVSSASKAQEQFRLSDYKNPDYRWQKLDLRFGLGGDNNYNRHEIDNGINHESNISQFSSGIDIDYFATKNSSNYQGYQLISLATDLVSSWYKYEDLANDGYGNDQKNKNGNISLNAETVNRFYGKKKKFLETDFNLGSRYYRSVSQYSADQESLPYNDKTTIYRYEISASLPLLVGVGRIEEVQDARLAVYILDDLALSGDLTRTATNEEILAFSEFITKTKNQRYFDARLRKISEITAIDSFLTVTGLKAESDASYYTLINDNWEFSSGPVRRAGGRFSIGLVPQLNMTFEENERFWRDTLNNPAVIETYSDRSNSGMDAWGLDFLTGYTLEKPASLYWQHTIDASLAYSLYHQNVDFKNYEKDSLINKEGSRTNSPNILLDLGYKVGYYPNSRTQIMLGINTSFNQYWGNQVYNDENEVDVGLIFVKNHIHLSCYYYFSPQLRLMLGMNSIYSFTSRDQAQSGEENAEEFIHDFQNSISASLTYSIF